MSGRAAVVIAAGGAGRRFGGTAKPFLPLRGEPVLLHALRPFLERSDIETVAVVLPAELVVDPPSWLVGLDPRITIVAGGEERTDSVRNGIDVVPATAEVIVVHDAARPLVTGALIERVMAEAYAGRGAIAAIRPVDTVHEIDGAGRIVGTPERRGLRQAQTPQAFPRALLVDAYRRAAAEGSSGTDEAALVARYGGTVVVVEGDRHNLKVTVPADLQLAEALLAARTRP